MDQSINCVLFNMCIAAKIKETIYLLVLIKDTLNLQHEHNGLKKKEVNKTSSHCVTIG